jgi:IclR family pca regulon transcriptional regulator
MSPALNVGRRLPAYCTSIGRVVLAHLPDKDVSDYLSRAQFRAFNPQTVTSREELRRILKAARQAGYATADQQMEPHFRTIAVPVRNRLGAVVAGINVIIPHERLTVQQMATKFFDPLRIAAEELSLGLLT